ncbi:hypothetical protein FSP39_007566 [Pinctada imbricata]|uniref:RNA-directed DNA polymerase from mobile element jockey n=1 Tax=Pinctada imbricata TaxID=66713 RepID=A0AA88XJX4_PINIB|nr:hypothetical protein FSP39_007566 [Pinctada imbricata]
MISLVKEGSDSDYFIECIKDSYLIQHVEMATRFRGNQRPTLLDLILTNEENVVQDLNYLAPVGNSDHCSLLFSYVCKAEENMLCTKKFRYDKGNYDEMRKLFTEVDWIGIMSESESEGSVQELWDVFREKMEETMDKCIPVHNVKNKSRKTKQQMYMDAEGMRMVRRKNKAWEKYMKSREQKDYLEYCDVRNALREHTKELRCKFEENIANEVKENPRAFWKYTRSKTTVRSGVGDLKDKEGVMHSDDKAKAEILNSFFCRVFTNEDLERIPSLERKHYGPTLSHIDINEETVVKCIQKLKPGKSAGPDGFHPRVLKEIANEIALPLSIIFRKSIESGRLPCQWKLGQVTPIFKKGDRNTPGNYRPVSVTAVLCKVMETIVREHVMKHMVENKLFL